jgi:hypothetical protein
MDLADETGRASTRRADSASGYLPAAAIADLAGTDACAGEDTAISDLPHVMGDGSRSVEREAQSEKAPLADLDGTSETDLKQCVDKHLGTKFRQRENPLYLAFLIGHP